MILYLHGLESSPQGHKGRYLTETFGAHAVDLDTRAAIAARDQAIALGAQWTVSDAAMAVAFETPMFRALAAIDSQTKLIIGSSFGGAVLMKLIAMGAWRGPSLFICPAAAKLTPHRTLPGGFPVIVLHGRRDSLIPIADSRELVKSAGPGTMLWEIDDDHRMRRIVDTGILSLAVQWLLSPQALAAAGKPED